MAPTKQTAVRHVSCKCYVYYFGTWVSPVLHKPEPATTDPGDSVERVCLPPRSSALLPSGYAAVTPRTPATRRASTTPHESGNHPSYNNCHLGLGVVAERVCLPPRTSSIERVCLGGYACCCRAGMPTTMGPGVVAERVCLPPRAPISEGNRLHRWIR